MGAEVSGEADVAEARRPSERALSYADRLGLAVACGRLGEESAAGRLRGMEPGISPEAALCMVLVAARAYAEVAASGGGPVEG